MLLLLATAIREMFEQWSSHKPGWTLVVLIHYNFDPVGITRGFYACSNALVGWSLIFEGNVSSFFPMVGSFCGG